MGLKPKRFETINKFCPDCSLFVNSLFSIMTIKAVIFDFDGTIADTYDTFVEIVNDLSEEFGYRPVNEEDLARFKKLSSREIIKQAEIPLVKIPLILHRVKAELRNRIHTLKPIQGMDSLLIKLKEDGYILGIITSNAKENVVAFLKNHDLEHLFEFIYSGTTLFGKHTVIERACRCYQLSPKTVIYVGDETRDILAARKSRVVAVAAAWGFHSPEILLQHNPNILARAPLDILSFLQQWHNPSANLKSVESMPAFDSSLENRISLK
jgi:phosphoglycolate phosphatase